jgi:hypothetical protein
MLDDSLYVVSIYEYKNIDDDTTNFFNIENGHLSERKTYFKNLLILDERFSSYKYEKGVLISKDSLIYYPNGNLLERYYFAKNSGKFQLDKICSYVYENDKLIIKNEKYCYKDAQYKTEYEYNDKNDLILEKKYYLEDSLFLLVSEIRYYSIYEHIDDKQIKKSNYKMHVGFDNNKRFEGYFIYDTLGRIVEEYVAALDNDFRYINQYNENNNLIKCYSMVISKKNSSIEYVDTTYNKFSNNKIIHSICTTDSTENKTFYNAFGKIDLSLSIKMVILFPQKNFSMIINKL